MISIGFFEFQKRLGYFLDRARKSRDPILVTRPGLEAVVILPLTEYEAMTAVIDKGSRPHPKASPSRSAAAFLQRLKALAVDDGDLDALIAENRKPPSNDQD